MKFCFVAKKGGGLHISGWSCLLIVVDFVSFVNWTHVSSSIVIIIMELQLKTANVICCLLCWRSKLAKLRDAIPISISETIDDSLTDPLTERVRCKAMLGRLLAYFWLSSVLTQVDFVQTADLLSTHLSLPTLFFNFVRRQFCLLTTLIHDLQHQLCLHSWWIVNTTLFILNFVIMGSAAAADERLSTHVSSSSQQAQTWPMLLSFSGN